MTPRPSPTFDAFQRDMARLDRLALVYPALAFLAFLFVGVGI